MSGTMSEKFIVQYRNELYDITNFVHKHPGGVNTLKGLENTDMTQRFLKAPPHSDAAMYLMKEYKHKDSQPLNGLNGHKRKNKHLTNDITSNQNKINDQHDEIDGLADQNSQFVIDESMEHLVDWSKAMIPQIGNLKDKYAEWVNKPVDRPLKLFDQWYLEILTHTPWWVVPLFWIPVISYLIYAETLENIIYKKSMKTANVITGVFLWTLIEYSLHRWVFHMNIEKANKWACTFHFVIHGLHHKVPFDSERLVFPPVPAIILASILYIPVYLIAPYPRLLLAGGLVGYLGYDLMHYYLHYGSPRIWHLYQMKRYHYQHHFVHHDLGFGISSPLWDVIFDTRIYLRKLKYFLKW